MVENAGNGKSESISDVAKQVNVDKQPSEAEKTKKGEKEMAENLVVELGIEEKVVFLGC
jgi:hypothetical protein